MHEFKPVRAKATTKEAAIEQALQITGASYDDVDVEVLEESDTFVTVRVSPLGTIEPAATEATTTTDGNTDEVEVASADSVKDSSFSTSDTIASSEAQRHACEVAQDLLDRMGLDAKARLTQMPEVTKPLTSSSHTDMEASREFTGGSDLPRTFIDVEGEDVSILIGKHGQTLRAFQYLLNLTINNSESNDSVYVMVDAGDYRARRAAVLERAVHNAIDRARGEHRAVRLEPMPAHERRIVHMLLQSEPDLTTSSEGREPWRRVIVAPQGVRASFSRGSRSSGARKPRSRDGNRNRHYAD